MTPASFRVLIGDVRTLTAKEALHRAADLLTREVGWYSYRFPAAAVDLAGIIGSNLAKDPETWRRHLLRRTSPRFFFSTAPDQSMQFALRSAHSDDRAEAIIRGEVLLFGRPVPAPAPVDWHLDLQSGIRWPSSRSWWRTPLYRAGGDVRIVWELNRHRELFVLGRAYRSSESEEYAQTARDRVQSWLASNPPEVGVNWASSLEIALRSIAFIWAIHFFAGSPSWDANLIWRITQVLATSGRHLARHLRNTEACMPGNHVVGDAAGLAVIALTLPELQSAAGWRTQALRILRREAITQVRIDGMHVELAPSYQAFVWELFYTVARLAEVNGEAVPELWRAVEQLAIPLCSMVRPDGTLPQSGDGDEAVGFDLDRPDNRIRVVAAITALRCKHPVLDVTKRPSEAILWLEGSEAYAQSVLGTAPVTPHAPVLYASGFAAVGRTDWSRHADWCFLRGGGTSRHTHADALHLEIAIEGRPILVDPGTGTYTGVEQWRKYFRGTRSHNTVCVGDRDQAVMHRSFRWIDTPAVSWHAAALDPSGRTLYLDAEHDGYHRVGVIHRRQVLWVLGWGWIVLDRITSRDPVPMTIGWLAAGNVRQEANRMLVSDAEGRSMLWLATEHGLNYQIARGEHNPERGWHSPMYGVIEPRFAFFSSVPRQAFQAIATVCRRATASLATVTVETTRLGNAYVVAVQEGDARRTFRFCDDSLGMEAVDPACVS